MTTKRLCFFITKTYIISYMLQLYIILIGFYRSFLTLTIIALTKIVSEPLIINPLLENLLFNYSISPITILTVYFKQMQEGLLETILRVGQGFVMSGKRAFNYHESRINFKKNV